MATKSRHLILLVAFITLHPETSAAQKAVLLSSDNLLPRVYGLLATPVTAGPHPGVIVLHGSAGWRPAYAEYARTLADSGFVALAIDYYAETGPDTVSAQALTLWPIWQATVRRAARWLVDQPSVGSADIGLVGFSRGAFLAVSVASSIPSVKAVVDFYGGANTRSGTVEEQVHDFPPLLILHGEADTVVPVAFAHRLRDAVMNNGGEVEMHLYPGAHHAFNGTFSPTYSREVAEDSFKRASEFLKRRLRHK
jgi:carboxymethylenebutenolidase